MQLLGFVMHLKVGDLMILRRVIYGFVFCLYAIHSNGQFGRSGTPVSWNIPEESSLVSTWYTLPDIDEQSLIAEDQESSWDRSKPFRFAFAHNVDLSPDNSGRWTNLNNGDRIWILGISCPDAHSIALTFENINFPRGARLYVYSEDHNNYIGPLNSGDNTTGHIGTPHISGDRIVIEYYEPYAYRGRGSFNIDFVTQSYKDLTDSEIMEQMTCYEQVDPLGNSSSFSQVASSVMMMIVDYGQSVVTSTLINNSSSDGTPYVLASSSSLIGPPSSWVFLCDVSNYKCRDFFNCDVNSISGATIVKTDTEQGVALLQLNHAPESEWEPYFSGWKLTEDEDALFYSSFHHSLGMPLAYSSYSPSAISTLQDGRNVLSFDLNGSGRTYQGSLGAPLFDNELNVIGIFVGGNSECGGEGNDQYVMLGDSWSKFKTFLDPLRIVQDKFEGSFQTVEYKGADTKESGLTFFPNPAQSWIYLQTDGEEQVDLVTIFNSTGQVVQTMKPIVPTISLDGLPEGLYVLQIEVGVKVYQEKLLIR